MNMVYRSSVQADSSFTRAFEAPAEQRIVEILDMLWLNARDWKMTYAGNNVVFESFCVAVRVNGRTRCSISASHLSVYSETRSFEGS